MGIKEAVKELFHKKERIIAHPLTDEDRAKGLEIRRQNSQIKLAERQWEAQQRLLKLEDAIGRATGKKSSEEEMFLTMFMSLMQQGKQTESNNISGITMLGIPTGKVNSGQSPRLNVQQNEHIARLLLNKVPSDYLAQLDKISDADLLDIRQRLNLLRTEQP